MSFHLIAAPAPTSPLTACTPGVDGVPGGFVGSLMCGSWAHGGPHAVAAWVGGHRWQLAALLVLVVSARVALGWLRRRAWARHAARAVWVEVVPPVSATPTSTMHLWRLLATLLLAPRWWTWRPARLVWEVQATPTGMRCGMWVPPGINPTAVIRVLTTAWPGVRLDQTAPPRIAPSAHAAALMLTATRPDWFPLVDLPEPRDARRDVAAPEEDLLRAVYDGLAAAGRTGGGLLQVAVGRAPGARVAVLRRASTNPAKARRPHGSALVVRLLADGLRALVLGVLNLLSSGPSSRTSTATRSLNPADTEAARQARAKYATAPHLIVAVTATGLGPTAPAARAASADILAGFGLLSGHVSRRRLRRPIPTAMLRHTAAARMLLATVAETAALAGVPAEPAAYGLPSAAARQRSSSRDTHAAGTPHRTTSAATSPTAAAPHRTAPHRARPSRTRSNPTLPGLPRPSRIPSGPTVRGPSKPRPNQPDQPRPPSTTRPGVSDESAQPRSRR